MSLNTVKVKYKSGNPEQTVHNLFWEEKHIGERFVSTDDDFVVLKGYEHSPISWEMFIEAYGITPICE